MATTMTIARKKLAERTKTCTLEEIARRVRAHDPECHVTASQVSELRSGKHLPSLRLANAFAVVLAIACFEWFQDA